MIFSFGGGTRRLVLIAATVLTLSLSACSSDDQPADDPTATASTSTPDPKAADEAAVKDLVDRFWDTVVASENEGNTDPKQFAGVANGVFVESQLATLKRYKKIGLLRVGKPVISDVEVTIAGDSADIKLCKNEDGWTAEQDGEPVPNDKKFGSAPWGAAATKVDGTWLVTDVRLPPKGSKTCA
ncbi:hypothetical protein [Aeromicrobium sp.]|uniref:hypothetical protein n=1 Tax=Aeromicrobium sp. TaxID=1871063 RepID=UPI002FCC6138